MERYILDKLVKWKQSSYRKPLVLEGARQVGKTWILNEFGKEYFDDVAYISFYNNELMKRVFETDYNIERILTSISLFVGFEVKPNKTLIIFDEIQEAPKALEALKYFCENASEYYVAAAGSLLGMIKHKGVSYPVGRVDTIKMYPMCFCEFLEAMGEGLLAKSIIEKQFTLLGSFSTTLIDYLKMYYCVGGMPEVVKRFSENRNFVEARTLQKEIIENYQSDFGKHCEGALIQRIRMVWDSVPMQLSKENKKFFFGQIKKGARMSDFELAIQVLNDCGLIKKVNKVTKPALPLKAYIDFSTFKIFLLDIGLLGAMADLDCKIILDGDAIFQEFKGAFTEQFVLQELIATTEYMPYYYATSSATYEVDFMIQKENDVIPIEVKASTNLKSRSLNEYIKKYKPNQAIKLSMHDYAKNEIIVNTPLWAVNTI